jgi:methionyl-tRNA formyltransferase
MNIVYMGTSDFAVPTLARLFEAALPIVGVVTQPDKPSGRGQNLQEPAVKKKAFELHLPIYQPATLKNDEARALFQAMQPDLLVVVAYGKILPPWLLQLPRYGAINLHGSLLPKYRGAAPIHWAIANGETETGVCTMQLDEGMDTGPVYLCEKTPIEPDETVPELSKRLADIGKELTVRTIHDVIEGKRSPKPQNPAEATYAPILKKTHGYIDWTLPAPAIHNRVRAFTPWPGSVSRFRNSVCKILKTKVTDVPPAKEASGTIVVEQRMLTVVCGEGTRLEILQIQPENRKPVSGWDFVNGARIQTGEKFERMTDND